MSKSLIYVVSIFAVSSFGQLASAIDVVFPAGTNLTDTNSGCKLGSTNSALCHNAVGIVCNNRFYGLPVSGYGPLEIGKSDVQIACVPANFVKFVSASFSSLREKHPDCQYSNPASDVCFSAIHRYCQAAGYASGHGYTYHYPSQIQTAYISCFSSAGASEVHTTFSELKGYHSDCSSASVPSDSCNAAINRFCAAKGYGSGFGPVEHFGDAAVVTCTKPSATLKGKVGIR